MLPRLLLILLASSGLCYANAQYIPPKLKIDSPLGISLVNGSFSYQVNDLSIGPLDLQRSYVSGKAGNIPRKWFGPHWTHNYDIYVLEGAASRFDSTYVSIGRETITFSKSRYGFLATTPESSTSSLEFVGGAFIFTNKDGDVYTFDPSTEVQPSNVYFPRSQRVAKVAYADGRQLDFIYSSGLLTKVTSNLGYAIVFEYGGGPYVTRACVFNLSIATADSGCAGSLASTSYSYGLTDGKTALMSVIDRFGQQWGYEYDIGPAKLSCVRQVNSSSCQVKNFNYGIAGVERQIDGNGGEWLYSISGRDPDFPRLPGQPKEITNGSYSGPAGAQGMVAFWAGLPVLYSISGRVYQVTYDGMMLAQVTMPEGNVMGQNYSAEYNPAGETWIPKWTSGLSSVASNIVYPTHGAPPAGTGCLSVSRKACNKPLYKTDYRGSRTDYSWDQNSGLLVSETGPANDAGLRPVTRNAYAQRYAWISAGGGYAPAGPPVWVLTSTKTCRTTATIGDGCAGGADDETITSYDYGTDGGPNNLLVRGVSVTANGVTQRTCFGYDAFGNKVWETKPRAGLSACPSN